METKSGSSAGTGTVYSSRNTGTSSANHSECDKCNKWVKNWMHKADRKTVDVYVGRWNPSVPNNVVGCDGYYGNPFAVIKSAKPGQPGSREDVVDQFAKMLYNDQTEEAVKLRAAVCKNLPGKTLACWCAPALCHAKVLAHFANCIKHTTTTASTTPLVTPPVPVSSSSSTIAISTPTAITLPDQVTSSKTIDSLQKSGVRKMETVNPFVIRKKLKLSNNSSTSSRINAST